MCFLIHFKSNSCKFQEITPMFIHMIRFPISIGTILICFLFIISGVQGVEITAIQITLDSDGSAQVNADYLLNNSERTQYDLITHLINPIPISEDQIGKMINRPVKIHSITPESFRMTISNYTLMRENSITTPKISFLSEDNKIEKKIQGVLDRFDLSFIPHQTTISFPDGYTEKYVNTPVIPPITHQVIDQTN